jgi:para-nitrobenzyl esterase
MTKNLKPALAAALLALSLTSAPISAQTLTLKSGIVRGQTAHGVSAFLGIPYAAAPMKVNRWRAPQPVAAWKGVRDATHYGHDCAQEPFALDSAPSRVPFSEDCLFLNVWKPAIATKGAKLPIMVWVHGGGFVNGGTSPEIYNGENFARDGVVLVSLNYRLGRYGFFAHPALMAEGVGANFGFLDQIAALKWVQANAAAIGGDASNVTVFGESAGGMSMHMLLQAPAARGLFHKVIIESGGGRALLRSPTMAKAAQAGLALAPHATAAELRALPESLVTGDLSMAKMAHDSYAGPMQDGVTFLGYPNEAIPAGLYANVPVMVGANSADAFPFVTDKDKLFAAYGKDEAEARKLYDADGKTPGIIVATRSGADASFIEPARLVARGLAKRGQPVYLYRFAHNGSKFGLLLGGAPHASELSYVFNTEKAQRDGINAPQDGAVASLTHRYWVNFAKYGKPDGDGTSPAWPAATADDTKVQLISSDGAAHVEDPVRASVDFTQRHAEAAEAK